jgi:hypothetical protein
LIEMQRENSVLAAPSAAPNLGPEPARPNNESAVPHVNDVHLETLRTWCFEALDASASGVISLDRLRDICRGTAAATGMNEVQPIDVGRIALALTDDADWEVVCRRSRPRIREDC